MTRTAAGLVSAGILLTLGFDTVPLPIPVQVAPLASLLALLALPLALRRFRATPLLRVVLLFFGYVVVHSVVALILDFGVFGQPTARASMWARQLIALSAGLAVYVVLRTSLVDVPERRVRLLVLVGAVPTVLLALLNLLWGLTGSAAAGAVVTGIRRVVAPFGFTAPYRASGLSLEPALLALFLGLVVIPLLILGLHHSRRRALLLCYLLSTLLAFGWTFSATGAGVLFILCGVGLILGPERPLFGGAIGVASLGVVLLVLAIPQNYAVIQVSSVLGGRLDVSATTKLFSTVEPVRAMPESLVPIGYGLGGSPFHLQDVVSAETYRDIVAVSWAQAPSLKTWWGRILTETGLFGAALVLAVVLTAAWQARSLRHRTSPDELRMGRMAIVAAIAYLLGASVASGLGSYALPWLWFWLAVVDSRYLRAELTAAGQAETVPAIPPPTQGTVAPAPA